MDCLAVALHWHGVAVVQLDGGGGVSMLIETSSEPPGGMLRPRSSTTPPLVQLVVAGVVEVQGPFQRENPSFDSNQAESESNKKTLPYYKVIEWDHVWEVWLNEDLPGGHSFVATIQDQNVTDPEDYYFTVWGDFVYYDKTLVSGVHVFVRGMTGPNGNRLQVIGYEGCPTNKGLLFIPS